MLSIKHKFKVLFLFTALSISNSLGSQSCQSIEVDMKQPYQRIIKLLDAHEGNLAFILSDSLTKVLDTKNINDCPLVNWIKYYKAISLCALSKFASALDLFHESLKGAESNEQWELMALCHIYIGLCHEVANLPIKCRSELEIARKIIAEHQLSTVIPIFSVRYSSYYRIYDNIDSAKYFANLAVNSSDSTTSLRTIADAYFLLGVLEIDPFKSIQYDRNSIEAYLKSNNFLGAGNLTIILAKKYFDIGKVDEYQKAIDSSFKYLNKVKTKNDIYYSLLERLYKMKINYFHSKGQSDSANYYTKISKEIIDKAKSITNKNNLESNYIDIAIANEKAKSDTIKKNNTYLRYGLIIISSLLLIIFWLFYRNIIQIKKIKEQYFTINNKNLDLNELLIKQNVLLSEVHHRVKNNLQLVISMITVLSKKLTGDDQIQLLRDVTNKIHSMALIHEQLYKKNDFDTIELGEYFNELAENFKSIQAKDFTIAISLQPDKIKTNIETAIPLGVILTELISNSLKYVSPTDLALKINIDLTYIEQKYIIKYSDNGKGYHQDILEQQTGSMGFSIIKNMTRQLQAESKFYNENGAVYSMVFKQKNTSQIITNP